MKKKAGFLIVFILAALIYGLLLELSLNTIWGWALFACVMAAFLWIHVYKLSRKKAWIRLASWLILFAALAVIYIISYPPYKPVPAVSAKNPQPSGTITLEQGALTGVCNGDGSVEVYTGIPYAKAPVGDLRWREPQEPDQWEGVLVCDHFAPRFMQHEYSTLWDSLVMLVIYNEFDWFDPGDNFREPMSEDALYVNIWKPRGDISGCPVIFFIHGGSLQTGTPSYDQYNGEAFARRGIVFVDFGYRLNVFGYFADEALALESSNKTTGNYGLLDQIAALRWVHENIRAFGGDPDNITIAGESAGASSVNALCVSPLARGLFRRAIAESSGITANRPYHTFRSYEDALDMKSAVYEAMGAASVDELRKIDARTLVRAAGEYNSMTVDGYAIQKQPALIYQAGENNEEALLNGFNSSEADVFSILGTRVTKENYAEILNDKLGSAGEAAARLYPAGDAPKAQYNEVMSGAWFAYSHHTWSRYLATQNRPVYEYWFTKTNRGLSDNHAGELPYFYGNLDSQKQNYNSTDYDLSETIMDYLENYVRNGNPNGEGLTEWTDFSEDETQLLELGEHIGMTRDPYLELYKALDKAQSESNTPLQAEGHE